MVIGISPKQLTECAIAAHSKLHVQRLKRKTISPFEIERYKIKRRDSITERKKPRSKSSVNHELKLLSCIFQLAKLQKQVRVNPCLEVAKLKG